MTAGEFKLRFLPLSQRLYRTAWSLTHNVQDAEDLVQDAYSRLWSKRNSLGDISNDEAYCVRMVKNLFLDSCRTKVRHDTDIGPPDDLQLQADDNVQQRIERNEAAKALYEIIDALPERQRVAIVQRDLQDRDFAQIAFNMAMPEASVRVLLSRARRKVKEQFLNWMNHDN